MLTLFTESQTYYSQNLKMATLLRPKTSSSLVRISSSFLRNFSSTTTPAVAEAAGGGAEAAKPKSNQKKKKNLFEVAQFLPNWGIGYHMAKSHWTDVSYQITKINLYKDGKHGKAWGIAHQGGIPIADVPKKISGVHKCCWKYIRHSNKTESNIPKLSKPEDSTPKPELQTA